jgi:urease accessory protein UreF
MTPSEPSAEPGAHAALEEWHPLLDPSSPADSLFPVDGTAVLDLPRVTDRATLLSFLEDYRRQLLGAVELPAIERACRHAQRNEWRELLALDAALSANVPGPALAAASRRAGQGHLRRLRPLRDQRVVQRYLTAVEAGEAHGWHTLVFGITLAVYSLPVRQGLMTYARQALRGFIQAAAGPLRLDEDECLDLLEGLCGGVAARVESIVAESAPLIVR